jgi:hypothetical protein
MKKLLLLLAALVILSAGITWLATGASHGWTKTSVQVMTLDPVTGIESPSYPKKFVAGVDFLAAAAVVAVLLVGASFLFRTKKNNQPTDTNL